MVGAAAAATGLLCCFLLELVVGGWVGWCYLLGCLLTLILDLPTNWAAC